MMETFTFTAPSFVYSVKIPAAFQPSLFNTFSVKTAREIRPMSAKFQVRAVALPLPLSPMKMLALSSVILGGVACVIYDHRKKVEAVRKKEMEGGVAHAIYRSLLSISEALMEALRNNSEYLGLIEFKNRVVELHKAVELECAPRNNSEHLGLVELWHKVVEVHKVVELECALRNDSEYLGLVELKNKLFELHKEVDELYEEAGELHKEAGELQGKDVELESALRKNPKHLGFVELDKKFVEFNDDLAEFSNDFDRFHAELGEFHNKFMKLEMEPRNHAEHLERLVNLKKKLSKLNKKLKRVDKCMQLLGTRIIITLVWHDKLSLFEDISGELMF